MGSRLSRPLAALLLLLLGLVAQARAADAPSTGDAGMAVLGLEALDAQDNAIANDISEALRQRVVAGKLGSPQLQGKDLVEIKLIFSCSDDAPACLAQAAKSLGAGELLFGNVKRSGGELLVSLKLLDATRGALEGSIVESIPRRKTEPAALRTLAGQWLAKLNSKGGGAAVATLIIRSNVVGAVITLDGTEAGVTTKKGLTLSDLSPGKHEITAERSGYGRISQQFSIAASQALPLTLALQPDGTDTGEGEGGAGAIRVPPPMRDEPGPEDSSLRGWVRTSFWVALGATAVSLGLATKYGLDVRKINSDLDAYRNPATPLNDAQQNTVRNKLADGNRAETRQWIFVGVGSAFAVASGFLFYKGYLDKEAGGGTRTSDNHGLRIFPTANPSSGGISGGIPGGIAAEFDF